MIEIEPALIIDVIETSFSHGGAQQRNRKPSVEEPRSADPDPLPQGCTGYAGATVVIVPFDPRYLSFPVFDIQYPTASGIHRRRDRRVSNRDYALSGSKLAGGPETDVATRC